jgi:hypothetical protein
MGGSAVTEAARLITEVRKFGATIRKEGHNLRVVGTRPLPAQMLDRLKTRKGDVLDALVAEAAASQVPLNLDRAELVERAAIVEHDGGIPRAYADEFARLQQWCPAGVPEVRWRQFINDGGVFLDRWGDEALRRGWQPSDLFGLDPVMPMARYDRMGLLWLLHGQTVSALRATEAALSGGHVYRRKQAVLPTPFSTTQTK